ncbi:MAG: hypothetical protein OK474_10570 [Thaumarchaeota archaeon]|nr:hypothetical protein [Nitrososphaerota archaeon]
MNEAPKPDLGIYYEMLRSLPPKQPSLSFLSKEWGDVDAWRTEARRRLSEQMNFAPDSTPLNSSTDSKRTEDGMVIENISYDMPYGPRTRGYFIYPEGREKLAGVAALHDHGGFFYYGKEKIVETGIRSPLLDEFKSKHYGGRSWATELAKRGFAVLAVDSFMWGSRRIPLESMNPAHAEPFRGLREGSDEFIRAYNHYWDSTEAGLTMSTVLCAGTTWPGIVLYEDRRSVDYLVSRPEVDAGRIGCGGLSGGALRSAFLTGMDPRIKAGFCVGWMSTLGSMLRNHIQGHDVIMYVPHLLEMLDIPDVMALHAPLPLLSMYDREDGLFSLEGQTEAHNKIGSIYEKMGYPKNYEGKFYPGPHKFDVQMQEDAFEWLREKLKPLP